MNENLSIAEKNATILGIMSTIFCGAVGLPYTEEVGNLIVAVVITKLAMWYKNHGEVFNPKEIPLNEDAVAEVFAELHADAILTTISAQTGIGLE